MLECSDVQDARGVVNIPQQIEINVCMGTHLSLSV